MSESLRRIDAMRGQVSGVAAWSEPVIIPTYPAMEPDPNPMFLEKRVYQGSSGKVYPLPFTDRVSTEKVDREYQALHLENEHIYLMVLPEIGGRIHIGFDKVARYDFFYRQTVIKPALVGLAGPWISGGVEFNWPQHHRPGTYMPCEWTIEESEDGSKTLWLSEHDPMSRMKGMHGICIRPNSSLIELKARLYNRTNSTQTFLWWANVAARVHEKYQSFFPPDVRNVADHAKRAMVSFPHVTGDYYGVHYGERGIEGVPKGELPEQFLPDGSYAPDRLDWYANIPVPTSYMVVNTDFNFFGGYDHAAHAGFVHVADRHISPGKKQWTWGNHDFGYAWDRNLTDDGGPYVELMAGVYTDNQPDFSFLAPHETKSFSQFWYPIREIGVPVDANEDLALSISFGTDNVQVGISASRRIDNASVEMFVDGTRIWAHQTSIEPSTAFTTSIATDLKSIEIRVFEGGIELIRATACEKPVVSDSIDPDLKPATEPAAPEDIASNDELYVIGVHLEQYRHATRMPEIYWQEAIRRDPKDSRCQHALGRWHLRRGEFELAEHHLRLAISRQTERNPNPRDGEPLYDLGLTLEYQGDLTHAYAAYAKSAWNYATKGAAYVGLARICGRLGQAKRALAYLDQAKHVLGESETIHTFRAAFQRHLGNRQDAHRISSEALKNDPLDHGALFEQLLANGEGIAFSSAMRGAPQNYLDLAFDYLSFGLVEEAKQILDLSPKHIIVEYCLQSIDPTHERRTDDTTYVFPSRLEEMLVLEAALSIHPNDPEASYLLGNFMYDRRRYQDAVQLWECCVHVDSSNAIAWRNLGIAYHNFLKQPDAAKTAYDKAIAANPNDARLLFERDQLWKRTGVAPKARLEVLEGHLDMVQLRDDLALETCALWNATGQMERSRDVLQSREFAPWEGGEGVSLGQHSRTYSLLARRALSDGNPELAVQFLQTALTAPINLGEARHLLANPSDLWVALGDALNATGQVDAARQQWLKAAEFHGDFQEMSVRTYSEMTYYRALALRRLEREQEATDLLQGLLSYASDLENSPAKIDYFATSLPTMLLFDEDLQQRQSTTARFLAAQAHIGLGNRSAAKDLLADVLQRDPNLAPAQDLFEEISNLES